MNSSERRLQGWRRVALWCNGSSHAKAYRGKPVPCETKYSGCHCRGLRGSFDRVMQCGMLRAAAMRGHRKIHSPGARSVEELQ